MSEVLARHRQNINDTVLLDDESDDDLMEQMAIRMAALLPNDPVQGARVLALVSTIYDMLTESRSRANRH